MSGAKVKLRRINILVFVLLVLMGSLMVSSIAEAATIKVQGVSGNIKWSIDTNGHLLITGSGNYELDSEEKAPWNYDYGNGGTTTYTSATVKVKNITSCKNMFRGAFLLKSVDFSGSDTSKVTDMSYMFTSSIWDENVLLDISSLDTSKVTNMEGMFLGTWGISGDLRWMDTSKVTNMSKMFRNARLKGRLNLTNFDTSKVTDMSEMFGWYGAGEQLDLRNFDLSSIKSASKMKGFLENNPNLKIINTPKNCKVSVDLAIACSGTWKAGGVGSTYKYLPKNSNKSITIATAKVVPTKWVKENGKSYAASSKGMILYVTGVYKINGKFVYVVDGRFRKATGLINYDKNWWYIKAGYLCTDTTLVKHNGKYYYVTGGKVSKDTTLVKYGNYYWYVSGGTTKNVTTIAKYNGKYYFVYKGKVNFNYSGTYVWNGVRWKIVKGVVVGRA